MDSCSIDYQTMPAFRKWTGCPDHLFVAGRPDHLSYLHLLCDALHLYFHGEHIKHFLPSCFVTYNDLEYAVDVDSDFDVVLICLKNVEADFEFHVDVS